jgi:hypothetical protein
MHGRDVPAGICTIRVERLELLVEGCRRGKAAMVSGTDGGARAGALAVGRTLERLEGLGREDRGDGGVGLGGGLEDGLHRKVDEKV